jgi:hypothetical protein
MAEPDQPRRRRRPAVTEPLERLPWLRYDRMARAVTERLRVRPVRGQPFWALEVRNPVHHTHYLVLLPEYPADSSQFCSCPDFARRGIGTCKHVEAATAWLESHPETPRPPEPHHGTAALWQAIGVLQRMARTSSSADAVRLRQAGRLLFERREKEGVRPIKKGVGGKGSVEPKAAPGI